MSHFIFLLLYLVTFLEDNLHQLWHILHWQSTHSPLLHKYYSEVVLPAHYILSMSHEQRLLMLDHMAHMFHLTEVLQVQHITHMFQLKGVPVEQDIIHKYHQVGVHVGHYTNHMSHLGADPLVQDMVLQKLFDKKIRILYSYKLQGVLQ